MQNILVFRRGQQFNARRLAKSLVVGLRARGRLGGWLALVFLLMSTGCTQEPRVTFLPNEAYFDALIPHLAQAKHEIVIGMFLFAPGDHENNRANQVKEALIDAAKRGVRVRVLLDASDDADFSTEANRGIAKELRRRGVSVQFDSPTRTTHTKLVIIDQRYVFLGSHNFTHSALRHNNEASVLIESAKLAQQALNYLQGIGGLSGQEMASGPEGRRLPARQSR
jgi:phosphatidylserine/phosphatidylglycerophosphate/cardiolipin synthase-like enzyme